MRIRWLRPDKPEDVSVGRHRIAAVLEERGHEVRIENATQAEFLRVLREPADADVVVGTTRLGALVAVWQGLVRGTPAVVDHIDPIAQFRRNHGRLATAAVGLAERVAFRLADHVMVVYEEELPRVRRDADGVTATSLGVDYERFADPDEAVVEAAQDDLVERGLDPDGNRVIYVGGLEPAYNVTTAADAMAHLPDWEFLVLGDGSQRSAIESHPQSNVHYLGTVAHERVPGYLHASDVGISLVDDRNTLKLLEYGAVGLPAVNVAGDAEERFEGLVEFCSLDPADVAAAVERAAEREEREIENYREFVREFDWRSVADDYEAAIERVAMGPRAERGPPT